MPRARPQITPRMMNKAETAAYLGWSATWLNAKLSTLYAKGFPRPVPLLERWDRYAINRWIDRMGGQVPLSEADHGWDVGLDG